jgi:hypothetical protein
MGLIFVLMVLYIPGGLTQVIQYIKSRFFTKHDPGDTEAIKEALP